MSKRILIIEDTDHLRQVLKFTLEYKGYTVTEAGDGKAGLEAATRESFDLIFCDIAMPIMNGVEFVRRYRAGISRETPILMITAEGDELVAEALKAGATSVIRKPFEPIRLLEDLKNYLRPEA